VPNGALVHALRHMLASQAIEYGIDVVELHYILRHASVATTCQYLDAQRPAGCEKRSRADPAQRALRQAG
jgi:integrase